jgi:hypothetical protein
MDIRNPVPAAVAEHPIHAGPQEVAVPGRLSAFQIATFIFTRRIEMAECQKFCYWIDLHRLKKVKKTLEQKTLQLTDEAFFSSAWQVV